MVSKLIAGKATPHAKLLPSFDCIGAAGVQDGAGVAHCLSGLCGFVAQILFGKLFGKENFGQPLAGNFSGGLYGQHEFAVWISVVVHSVKCRRK